METNIKDRHKQLDSSIFNCHKFGHPCSGLWGCRFLTTPPPARPEDKETTFVAVYREAKTKEILSCPKYDSTRIDKYLDDIFVESNHNYTIK